MDEQFAAFVTGRYLPLVRRAFLLTGDRGEAEDLVQDALAGLLVAWRGGRVGDPERYVARTVTNRAISRWRRLARREVPSDLLVDRGDSSVVEHHFDREVLWQALGGLSPRQRAVLVLRYYEGLTDAEIAELIGVAQASVRSLSARALDKLRRDAGLRGGLEGVR